MPGGMYFPAPGVDPVATAAWDALGEGLGSYLGMHYAGKKLETLMQDPNFKSAPPSQQFMKLSQAMGMYGNSGKKIMGNMATSMAMQQEEKSKAQLANALSKMQRDEKLTPEDLKDLDPAQQIQFAQVEEARQKYKKQAADEASEKLSSQSLTKLMNPKTSEELRPQLEANLVGQDARTYASRNKGQAGKTSPLQTKLQQKRAEEYVSAEQKIPEIQDALTDLDEMEKLAHELSGPSGYWKATGITSSAPSELKGKGQTIMAQLKALWPKGATTKAIWEKIEKTHVPSPWDTYPVAMGKIKAARSFLQKGLKRQQDRMKLIEMTEGMEAQEAKEYIDYFDAESEQMGAQEILRQEALIDDLQEADTQPSKKGNKVKARFVDTGEIGWVDENDPLIGTSYELVE